MTGIAIQVQRLAEVLGAREWHIVTAESCTGGMIAAHFTDRAGSSAWFDRAFVTYSNRAKREMLGVSADTLAKHGAVSEAVVREMVSGALGAAKVEAALAVSGIAGPGGGSEGKPVGTVWFAWGICEPHGEVRATAACHRLFGDRALVREQTTEVAVRGMLAWLERDG